MRAIDASRSIVRWLADTDLLSLVHHANNRNIWINLRDRFPYPYPRRRPWVSQHVSAPRRHTVWAIEVDGEACGWDWPDAQTDVERVSAEIGYWLGEAFWGRGVTTEAVRAVTQESFRLFELSRIFALPFADNHGSIRVLEKAGYVHRRDHAAQSTIKDGIIRDQLQYGAYKRKWVGSRCD